ncbi:hypothetical protein LAZ67_20001545 [Cordylochernes scorpioides]|uniref:Uncharacterized protein n=1 Tax=Cordylochernes scorpioides TaxID=51811 RepID=A0ABY6LK97_9ARAC|nr:hypothetical protein LAZ67_20001545 [Cordylochernes scorpioides]
MVQCLKNALKQQGVRAIFPTAFPQAIPTRTQPSHKIGEPDVIEILNQTILNKELMANVKGKSLQIMEAQSLTMVLNPSQISKLIFQAPPFLPNVIALWLSQLEAVFIFANIVSDKFKYSA